MSQDCVEKMKGIVKSCVGFVLDLMLLYNK